MEEDSDKSFHQFHYHWQEQSLQSQDPEPSQPSLENNLKLQKELNDLNKAKDRFKAFLEEIGNLKYTPIRKDINTYCGTQMKAEKAVDNYDRPESLVRKLEIRIEKMLKTKRIKRNWGEQDFKILIWIISKYSDFKQYTDLEKELTFTDWTFISSLIPGVNAQACMFKWLSIKKITLSTHNWTKEESSILAAIVKERIDNSLNRDGEVKDWKEISQQLYKLNQDQHKVYRNAKQCRQHWTCYLSPHLKKGPWQIYQDIKLLKFIKDNKGLKKWSQIAKHFQGRTENALKNRYTLIIEKQKKMNKNKGKTEFQLINQYLEKTYVDQFTVKVKPEQNKTYNQSSIMKVEHPELSPMTNKSKKEELSLETIESTITPLRVQKFNFNDFETMNLHFFKHIQPGIIESNGTFKKIQSHRIIKELSSQALAEKESSDSSKIRKKSGPFTITPAFKHLAHPFTQ